MADKLKIIASLRGRLLEDRFFHSLGVAQEAKELAAIHGADVQKAYLAGLDVRREGAAALDLCTVAAGRAGVFYELSLSLWDYAAGKLIVEEAGGVCRTIDGEALPMDASRPSVAAGGRQAVEELLRLAK